MSPAILQQLPEAARASADGQKRQVDLWVLAGIAFAAAAIAAGIAATGVSLAYFFQPTAALIVLGGTFGVMFITTPGNALIHSARRIGGLFWARRGSPETQIEEIISFARIARTKGLLSIEPLIEQASNSFLRESLLLALDMNDRAHLEAALQTKLRLRERHGEIDAKTLDVAGGFAPTIGILGTVVGLIDVLRRFSDLSSVASGLGTAFVSTIYGLALANLILLPAAHRIRARVVEAFEVQELMVEGVLCVFDGLHPTLIRERLNCYLRRKDGLN
jgi:chemotaxis protein MotA